MKTTLVDTAANFTQKDEDELQRLVRKIKYNQPTIEDLKKVDELTRKKWKYQGIFLKIT